jgi:Peptidase S24-like
MATSHSSSDNSLRCDLIASAVQDYGEVQLRVTGDSMVPTLYPGAEVLIRKADFHSVTLGALAAFQRDGRLFIHRVVFVRNGKVVTCGDAHMNPDPAIQEHEFIGLVTTVNSGQGTSVRRKIRRMTHRLTSLLSVSPR